MELIVGAPASTGILINGYPAFSTIQIPGFSCSIVPVSYTHLSGEAGETRHIRFAPETDSFTVDSLDSYAAALWNLCIDTVKDGELIRYRLSGEHTVYENPVSYTHLDVYKRQDTTKYPLFARRF